MRRAPTASPCQGANSPPSSLAGIGRGAAIGVAAVMEVTKWLKPSISVSRIGDSASVLHTRSETMAEDDETATARYIAGNISTQLMLKTIVEIIGTMADDPDSDLRLFRILSLASLRRSAGRQRIRST